MAVAHTRRMHFAKKLIDETSLPMNQIAMAAGFGSVRRFNAGIRQFFHRTPPESGIWRGKRKSGRRTIMCSTSTSDHPTTGKQCLTFWVLVVPH